MSKSYSPAKQFNKILSLSSFYFLLLWFSVANGQTLPEFKSADTQYKQISLKSYLEDLNKANSTIQVRKLGNEISRSNLSSSKLPLLNPLLTYARGNISTQSPYIGYTNPTSNTIGAMVTVEGIGKRSARIAKAQAELDQAQAETGAEIKSVETNAILTYFDALRTKLIWQSCQEAIDSLAKFNTLESKKLREDFINAQVSLSRDLKFYSFSLMGFLDVKDNELLLPVGTLNFPTKNYDLSELVNQAQNQHFDLASGKAAIESANANIESIKVSKNIDLIPGLYYTETAPYSSQGNIYGSQKSVSFLVTLPIPNNKFYDADVDGAVANQVQKEIGYQALRTKITVEVNQAYLQYLSAKERLQKANAAFLTAKIGKDASVTKILAYRDALAELIDARTVHAKSMILLEKSAGILRTPEMLLSVNHEN